MPALRSFRFELFGCPFEVRHCAPDMREAIAARLPPLAPTISPALRLYAIESAGEGFVVTRSRRRPRTARHVSAAADLVVDDIERELARKAAGLVFVHAGAVVWRGRAILLPGRSGCGKSELTAELLRRGAEYLSDEFAVIDSRGRVHPYSRPLALRRAKAIERVSPKQLGARVRQKPAPIGSIAFLRYRRDGPWPPSAISPGETFLGLLRHTLSSRARFEQARPIFHRIATSVPAIAGRRREAQEAADFLLSQLRKPGEAGTIRPTTKTKRAARGRP